MQRNFLLLFVFTVKEKTRSDDRKEQLFPAMHCQLVPETKCQCVTSFDLCSGQTLGTSQPEWKRVHHQSNNWSKLPRAFASRTAIIVVIVVIISTRPPRNPKVWPRGVDAGTAILFATLQNQIHKGGDQTVVYFYFFYAGAESAMGITNVDQQNSD